MFFAHKNPSSFSWDRFNSLIAKDGRTKVRSGKVYEYFNNYIEELDAYEKVGTAEVYKNARDKFKDYRAILNFDEVTPEFLNAIQRCALTP